MMVMTAKVDFKKTMLALAAVAALILALILMMGGSDSTAQTGAPAVSGNDGRVKFLRDFGWDVTTSPVESGRVKIPKDSSEVFDRYNALQKSQGYDLNKFAGKSVMRYVYKVNNYPGATEPVYATLLVYKNQIIGGDITDTAAQGAMRGLQQVQPTQPATVPSETDAPVTQSDIPAE
jgi:hypothetical protein